MKKLMTEWRQFLNEEEQRPLTVGELIDIVEVLSSEEDKKAKKQKLKKLGGVAFKFAVGMIPVIGGALSAGVDVADNLSELYGAATDPQAINQGKIKNEPWVKMLGIDAEFSKIIDDQVETEFLKKYITRYTQGIIKQDRNKALPNFTDELAKYINTTKVANSPMSIAKK